MVRFLQLARTSQNKPTSSNKSEDWSILNSFAGKRQPVQYIRQHFHNKRMTLFKKSTRISEPEKYIAISVNKRGKKQKNAYTIQIQYRRRRNENMTSIISRNGPKVEEPSFILDWNKNNSRSYKWFAKKPSQSKRGTGIKRPPTLPIKKINGCNPHPVLADLGHT